MPPWAQTECERFTGTTENRSTSWPASAIFIAAAKPASPPPTIAILIPLAIDCVRQTLVCRFVIPDHRADKLKIVGLKNSRYQSARMNKSDSCIDAYDKQQQAERDACVTR